MNTTVRQFRTRGYTNSKPVVDCYRTLKRLALRSSSGNHDEAEDIAQEAAIRIWKYTSEFQCMYRVSFPFLVTVVKRIAIDRYRKRASESKFLDRTVCLDPSVESKHSDKPPLQLAAPDSVENDVEYREFSKSIRQFLTQLKPEHKQALLMLAEGYTYDQVAQQQSVPLGTVRSRVFYGRRKAKTLFSAYQ